jgi:hypothetical protein
MKIKNLPAPLERLGFIGLGNMGGAIALRLLRAGYPLTILDLAADRMAGLVKEVTTTGLSVMWLILLIRPGRYFCTAASKVIDPLYGLNDNKGENMNWRAASAGNI